MKRLFRFATMLLIAALLLPAMAMAQQMPQLPVDQDVRIGRLPNGLTYYIRHNEYPKGQADFYIAQKVGSILEEENQRGLAHFLEHMCFNGTTNFPGNSLISWLESNGVKFGQNLNAGTGIDQTVYYMSNVPIARENVQDSCLLILHDWANEVSLVPEEIEAERSVIHEEWRTSMQGQMRILEQLLPVMFPDSPYGVRLPIGTLDVIDNFTPQEIRDYYEKWYRPDLQGIIVVGDIDVDRIEGKIKEMFSTIEMPANAAERVYFPVADNEGTIYAIGKDKEQKYAVAEIMFKSDAFPDSLKNTPAYYATEYLQQIIASMLNTRLNDIASKPDAPFGEASASFGNMFVAKTKDAFTITILGHDNNLAPALAAAYREALRAARGGFTVSEYERARNEYMSAMEKAYNNRNQRENGQFCREYVNSFIDAEPIPGIETEYQLMQMLSGSIPVQAINQVMAEVITPDNRVLLAMLPETEGAVYPTEAEFAEALAAVDAETLEPYVDEVKSEPLIPALPAPGKIVAEQELSQWGATEWTLSNGVKVYAKKTPFKDDEVLFSANALGGTSVIPADKANSLLFMDAAMSRYGLGTYSNSDLQKYLAGKQVSLTPSYNGYQRVISGSSTPKDLSTLMELLYMMFTEPNFTPEEFQAFQSTVRAAIKNQEATPEYIFQTKVYESLYGNSPRVKALSSEVVSGADRAEIIEIAKQMTSNAADFSFVFVGNFDFDALRPLVEQYIATLPADPATAVKEARYLPELAVKGGKGIDTYTAPMETPKTLAMVMDWAKLPYTTENVKLASIAGQILSARLIEIVREKEGAVYSIWATGNMSFANDQPVNIASSFPMKPELKDKVLGIIEEQMNDLTVNVTPEELGKVKEYMIKSAKESDEKNASWRSAIANWAISGVDLFNGKIDTLNAITPADVQDFMKEVLSQGNYRVVILDPAE